MQHDEVIWSTLNHHFCSFKVTTARATFCRQKYNVSGMCNRSSCPLANSRYGTILERDGALILHVKTIERAHSPKNLWQKLRLSKNYAKALAQIDAAMEHWPPFLIHKAKQRLTKMTQYLLRKRKLLAGAARTVAVPIKVKTERRDAARERKAVRAAKLDTAIEAELLNRLKSGAYGDIYNFPRKQYERALGTEGLAEGEEEAEEEADSDSEEEETEGEDDGAGGAEFEAADDSDSEESSEEESEAEAEMEHEYEDEGESEAEDESSDDNDGGGRPAAARARGSTTRAAAADAGDDTDDSGSGSGSGSGSDEEGDDDDDDGKGDRDTRRAIPPRAAATPIADLEDAPAATADVYAFDDGSDLEDAVASAGGDERAALRRRSRKRLAAAAPAARSPSGSAAAAAAAATAAAATPQHKRVRFSGGADHGGGGGRAGAAPSRAGDGGAAAAPPRRRGTPRRARAPRAAAAPAGVRIEVEVETERGESVWEAAGV